MNTDRNNITALLIMDIQEATIQSLPDKKSFINPVNKAIQNARDKKIPVLYIVVGFRKDYPEISPDNKSFTRLKNGTMKFDDSELTKVYSELIKLPEEITIIKKRISAFAGSDLEVILRSLGIKHLVLSGIATSGVVLSTIREAGDKDFILTVLEDCCYDADEEVHRVLTTKIFQRQADVISVNEWIQKS